MHGDSSRSSRILLFTERDQNFLVTSLFGEVPVDVSGMQRVDSFRILIFHFLEALYHFLFLYRMKLAYWSSSKM